MDREISLPALFVLPTPGFGRGGLILASAAVGASRCWRHAQREVIAGATRFEHSNHDDERLTIDHFRGEVRNSDGRTSLVL